MPRIRLEDVPIVSELAVQGVKVVFEIMAARAKARGLDHVTLEDIQATKIELEYELGSGRSVGDLIEKLKAIAAGDED